MPERSGDIAESIASVHRRVARAAGRAGRDPTKITLVAVSKTVGLDAIRAAFAAGVRNFGENRVNDASQKFCEPRLAGLILHMVGQLQTNKAREAISTFDIIESVDRVHLVEVLQREAERVNRLVPVLIQINVAREFRKAGCAPDEALELVRAVRDRPNLQLRGLMTIAPLVANAKDARPYFRALAELRDCFSSEFENSDAMSVLSMGMSDDFEVAIEEGATHVRIGRALFSPIV